MTTALVEREPVALAVPVVTPDQLELVKRTVASGATDAELKLYLYDCGRQGVHPLDRLLHFTKRGGKYTPVTSIDLMRTRAADTNEYAGNEDAVFTGKPGEPDFAATVTVTRFVSHATSGRFTATARWSEYYPGDQGGHMWKKMPHTMLAKCAEALALRKGFPRQLAGLYAAEEMDQAAQPASQRVPSDPPQTLQNVITGEVVPNVAGTPKPEPPEGFAYLAAPEEQRNGWFAVGWQGTEYRTKLPAVISAAQQAYADGVPVKIHSKKAPWLDRVETWKPEDTSLCAGCGQRFALCDCEHAV